MGVQIRCLTTLGCCTWLMMTGGPVNASPVETPAAAPVALDAGATSETAPAPTAQPPPAEPVAPATAETPPASEASAAYPVDDEQAAINWLDDRTKQTKYLEIYPAVRPTVPTEKRPELMWRIARVIINYYEMKRTASDEERLREYDTSEELSRRCVAIDPTTTPACYLYIGISLGRQGTVRGVLKSLRLAREVEAVWLKGLDLSRGKPYMLENDSLESHFHYVLGIFYRIVPDWWIIKLIAGTRGDKQKSIDFHRESVRLRPDPSTWLELGVALMCRGDKEDDAAQSSEGKEWVEKVANHSPKNELDRIDARNASKILGKNRLACGYSRDKFQDVEDESKVK
jgi:hypothetical protein